MPQQYAGRMEIYIVYAAAHDEVDFHLSQKDKKQYQRQIKSFFLQIPR